jgi:hypothetical protein
MKIFGYIGVINPTKLNALINMHNEQIENVVNAFNLDNEVNNYSDVNLRQEKNELVMVNKTKKQKNKIISDKEILKRDKEKYRKNFDFQKAIHEKKLDSNAYYSMRVLMKILLNNNNYEVCPKIISLLKDILGKLIEADYPIIYLILPTLLSSINNFEENTKILIFEIIFLIIKSYEKQSLPYIEDILFLSEPYIGGDSKSHNFKDKNEKQLRDICLDIIDKLCESYSDEISYSYPTIIPKILGLLSDKEDITLSTKRKAISCLTHIGDDLSNYLYLTIPELINCLSSLMNKIKPIQNTAISQAPTSSKIFSSILRFNSGSRNDNGINLSNYMTNYSTNDRKGIDLRRTLEPKMTEVDEASLEKKLEQDILNLLKNLLHLPGVIKYMEKIIHSLCYYMEAEQSSQNDIMNIFIKMLDNFQDEFIVFFPYVLNFSKNIGISSFNYFKEFRYGLEKVDIMSLITKENLNPKTVLSNIGNINNNDNNNSHKKKESIDLNNILIMNLQILK